MSCSRACEYKDRIGELTREVDDLNSYAAEMDKKYAEVEGTYYEILRDMRLCRTLAEKVSSLLKTAYENRSREDSATIEDFVDRIAEILRKEEMP